MDGVIYASDLTDPEAAAVYRAAVSRYTKWCNEHRLGVVHVAKMTMNLNARTYALYDAAGGAITELAV